MNRESILASVHQQLRDGVTESGEVRPFGEIVARVATEIRRDSSCPNESVGVIPIERVAAFVEGSLEASESDSICRAVMVDNSVVAEIVAAVRTQQTDVSQLAPLPSSLSEQLISMQRQVVSDDPARSTGPPVASDIKRAKSAAPRPNHLLTAKRAATVAAIAATLVAAIVVIGRSWQPGGHSTALQQPAPDPIELPADAVVNAPPQPSAIIPADRVAVSADTVERADDDPTTIGPEPAHAVVQVDPESDLRDSIAERMPAPPPEMDPLADPDPVRVRQAEPLVDVHWTEVTGLLAQRDPVGRFDGGQTTADPTAVAAARRGLRWRRVREGAMYSDRPDESRVAVATLPFSRAEADLSEVGRLVVSADTGLQIERSPVQTSVEFDLLYGAIALVGVDQGATVKLTQSGQSVASLVWQSRASVVIQSLADGLNIQVDGGVVEVNQTDVREDAVQVGLDRAVASVRGPKRLPSWVFRADRGNAIDRSVLAQISDSDDLATELSQKIRLLANSANRRVDDTVTLRKLAAWQAAMAGPGIYRLAGSRIPEIRFAALSRLANLSESDPRYEPTWKTMDRLLGNPQRSLQVRAWFRLIRARRRPNVAQMNQLLGGLSNPDQAQRALSDFILRQYVANPPPFDPAWTGQTLQRAVNVYRQRAGVPIDRSRTNALSPSATN